MPNSLGAPGTFNAVSVTLCKLGNTFRSQITGRPRNADCVSCTMKTICRVLWSCPLIMTSLCPACRGHYDRLPGAFRDTPRAPPLLCEYLSAGITVMSASMATLNGIVFCPKLAWMNQGFPSSGWETWSRLLGLRLSRHILPLRLNMTACVHLVQIFPKCP